MEKRGEIDCWVMALPNGVCKPFVEAVHEGRKANTHKSVNGLNNYVREVFTKNYWLNEIYPAEVAGAHESGEIHLHDLGFFGPYCAGSRALADALARGEFPRVRAAEFGVVLDMVGDRDLQLLKEPYSLRSAGVLVERIWSIGQAAGFPQFAAASAPEPLVDDHVPLTEAGVPAILVIDYTFAPWHTHADTLDQLSADSLGAVGETLRLALRAEFP